LVGVVLAELHFPEGDSLKTKRMSLRQMRDILTRRYGATFAEVGYQDLWQRSRVVFAVAASDLKTLEETVDAALRYLESQEWDLVLAQLEVVEPDE
jgi:uncharacterized protein YlxP (DUF503 family)